MIVVVIRNLDDNEKGKVQLQTLNRQIIQFKGFKS